jgi:NitT/TauT family transport system substrate-binding protein
VYRASFASGLAGCAVCTFAAPRAYAQTLRPLHLGIAPSDGVTSVVFAKQAGLFERAGLDVTYDTQNNGSAVAAAVLSGFFGIGNASITSIMRAHVKGLPFTMVAPAGIYNAKDPFSGALVLKDSTWQLGKDAEGQTVSVASLDSTGHDAFAAWVEHHGGDWRKVRYNEIPFAAAAAAVLEKRVIAGECPSPAMGSALETGKLRLIPVYNALAPRFLNSAWFTSRDFSSKHPDIVKTFAQVVAAAGAYANTHHAQTAPALAQLTGIPVEEFAHMTRSEQGTVLIPSLIQPVIDAAHEYGSLERPFPAREVIDPNVVDLR